MDHGAIHHGEQRQGSHAIPKSDRSRGPLLEPETRSGSIQTEHLDRWPRQWSLELDVPAGHDISLLTFHFRDLKRWREMCPFSASWRIANRYCAILSGFPEDKALRVRFIDELARTRPDLQVKLIGTAYKRQPSSPRNGTDDERTTLLSTRLYVPAGWSTPDASI